MERSRILVIEDNEDTQRFLKVMLSKEYDVIQAENGVIGIEMARNQNPDLILLDIMLPILNGYDACSLLKKDEKTRHIPIIFLSAKNTVNDITQGLGSGADDYISKPFDFKELSARIATRLRQQKEQVARPFSIGDLKIDAEKREVNFGGKTIKLTLTEFDLLKYLAQRAGEVVSREEILQNVWTEEPAGKTSDRTIDVHVRALRRKIPSLTKHIVSVYGVGYKYEK